MSSDKPHVPIPCPQHPTYDLKKVIKDALHEDAGDRGDVTTQATVAPGTQAVGTFLAKSPGVLAGLGVADLVFELVDPTIQVQWTNKDGAEVEAGTVFGTVTGPASSILVAERIALNFMQRMSGIATATRAMVKAVAAAGGKSKVLETRKTVPGLRLLDKWAVLIGGGHNHRMGLYDMMMIKDNHVTAAGGLTQAVQRAEEYIQQKGLGDSMAIEVETRTMSEVEEALQVLASGKAPHVKRLMLDNMTRLDPGFEGRIDVRPLQQAVDRIAGAVDTEASGNIVLETIGPVAKTGVTYISVGSLTHSVRALDISLKIKLQQ